MTGHDCGICEYNEGCLDILKFLHKCKIRECTQGRIRRGMRQTARDQARLPVEGETGAQKEG